MSEALLTVQGLKTHFLRRGREARAVDGVGLTVSPRQIVCIVGASGSGKSVTSLSIIHLLPKTNYTVSGKFEFDGRDLLRLTETEMTDVRGDHISHDLSGTHDGAESGVDGRKNQGRGLLVRPVEKV